MKTPRPARAGRPRSRSEPLGIKAVEQALDIVEVIAASPHPRSLTELSTAVGMEPGKLHRYLVSLRSRGLVKQDEGGGFYDLGPGALSLGMIALARLEEFDVVRAAADELGKTLGESVFVYVWSIAGPVLVHVRRTSYALVSPRIGSVVPLIYSAAGPIFATYISPKQIDPVLERDAADRGMEVEEARSLIAELADKIRGDRVLWSDATIVPDSAACAAPVFDAQGSLFCVIGVSFYLHGALKPPQEHIMSAVLKSATDGSRLLGYQF